MRKLPLLASLLVLAPLAAQQKGKKPIKPAGKVLEWPLRQVPRRITIRPPIRMQPIPKFVGLPGGVRKDFPGIVGGLRIKNGFVPWGLSAPNGPVARAPKAHLELQKAAQAIQSARSANDRKAALRAIADAQRALLEARAALFDDAPKKKATAAPPRRRK